MRTAFEPVTRRFAPAPESAAAARRFVAQAVREIGCRPDAVELLTSELVTNAIVHAETPFEVNVERRGASTVRVAVVNHAPELLPVFREPSGAGGRGIILIDRMAKAWGFERREGWKAVWFELSVDDDPRSTSQL